MKKLSVIVPCYNCEGTLVKCVDSIENSTYSNIEVILINDGSNDSTEIIMQELQNKYSNIHAFSKTNEGLGKTRNYGLKHATGTYITFIDSDDYIDTSAYSKMIQLLEKDDSDVVFCGFKYDYGDKIVRDRYDCMPLYNYGKQFLQYVLNANPSFAGISTCTGIYKKSLIDMQELFFMSERLYLSEDKLFNVMYIQHCKKVSVLGESLYYYVQHQGGRITTTYKEYKLDASYNMCSFLLENTDIELEQYVLCDYLVNVSACFQQIFMSNQFSFIEKNKLIFDFLRCEKYVLIFEKLQSDLLNIKFEILLYLIRKRWGIGIVALFWLNSKKQLMRR